MRPSASTTTTESASRGSLARASAASTSGGSACPLAHSAVTDSIRKRRRRANGMRGLSGPWIMGAAHESHRVNLLAFDTSTDVLSIAVQRGGPDAAPLEYAGPGGARASSTLIPAIQDLLARAGLRLTDLDAIVFGRGPGSFTGLRTACSVAQGLAFGAGVPVLAVDTLLAVAEDAHQRAGVQQVVAVLDARMDEVYSACYGRRAGQWRQQGETALSPPEALSVPAGWALAGNAFAAYGTRLPAAVA